MSEQASVIGAHGLRRAYPDFLYRFYAGPAVEDDRKSRHKANQQHGRNIAEAEPKQKQRRVGEAGDRGADRSPAEGKISSARRERPINTPMVTPMSPPGQTGEQANDCFDGVMRQDARDRQMHEGGGNFFQCRKQPARKYRPGDDLPNCADDDERKNIARDQPQALAALGTTGCMSRRMRDGILHLVPRSSRRARRLMSVGVFLAL